MCLILGAEMTPELRQLDQAYVRNNSISLLLIFLSFEQMKILLKGLSFS